MTEHDGELHAATRSDAQRLEARSVRWLVGGLGALVVMFAAGIVQPDVLGTNGHVFKGIQFAAIFVSIGALFRSAILHERAKRLKSPNDEP
jgi:hypothetical protein